MAHKITKKTEFKQGMPGGTVEESFWLLDKTLAYTMDELSVEWDVKPGTLKQTANKLECFVKMKTEKGWERVIVHPDTAKEIRDAKGN